MTLDEDDLKQREIARQQEREAQEAYELSKLCEIYEFRHFIWRLLGASGYFSASFRGEDTHLTAFHEGKRDIGARVFTQVLTVAPDLYTVLVREAEGRAQAEVQPGEPEDGD